MNLQNVIDSLNVGGATLASTGWLRIANILCVVGSALAILAAIRHGAIARSADAKSWDGKSPMKALAVLALVGAVVTCFVSIWNKGVEVNHFPSQTMAEVLVMFSFSLIVSLTVLHFALGLKRIGPGWAILDDIIMLLTLQGAWFTNIYSSTLVTAQRDLPPALQSYWFAPHLSALIFSYATLGIAGLLCLIYFTTKYWTASATGERSGLKMGLLFGGLVAIAWGLRAGHQGGDVAYLLWGSGIGLVLLIAFAVVSRGTRGLSGVWPVAALLLLVLMPFGQYVALPVLLLGGGVFAVLKWRGSLPSVETLAGLEKTLDQVSYKAFSVGFPFLTAGLFMGAFWAQEAWANYWGWDSKENSALITWLVYVGYVHLRMLGGYRGERAMAVLLGGALSVFLTFQVFGYLPDSQKSLHRYTDDGVTAQEGMAAAAPATEQARVGDATEPEGR